MGQSLYYEHKARRGILLTAGLITLVEKYRIKFPQPYYLILANAS